MQPRWCAMLLAISASAEEIIAAGNAGDARAIAATRSFSKYLAQGCCSLIQLLDPEALILSGVWPRTIRCCSRRSARNLL
jgi:predicted NBD/HSP70 family sugar kinase